LVGSSFAAGSQGSAGINPFSSPGMGARPGSIAPLFPSSYGPSRGAGTSNTIFGPAPNGLPSLNQVLRGGINLPLNSSAGSCRFTYQDVVRPGATFAGLDHPAASLMFSTTDLGNGVFFSAGTSYGPHNLSGVPSLGSAGAKHSGPSVNLKLSF
jgi:hypothetical protein